MFYFSIYLITNLIDSMIYTNHIKSYIMIIDIVIFLEINDEVLVFLYHEYIQDYCSNRDLYVM